MPTRKCNPRLATLDWQLPTGNPRLATPDWQHPTGNTRLATPDWQHPTGNTRLATPDWLVSHSIRIHPRLLLDSGLLAVARRTSSSGHLCIPNRNMFTHCTRLSTADDIARPMHRHSMQTPTTERARLTSLPSRKTCCCASEADGGTSAPSSGTTASTCGSSSGSRRGRGRSTARCGCDSSRTATPPGRGRSAPVDTHSDHCRPS